MVSFPVVRSTPWHTTPADSQRKTDGRHNPTPLSKDRLSWDGTVEDHETAKGWLQRIKVKAERAVELTMLFRSSAPRSGQSMSAGVLAR